MQVLVVGASGFLGGAIAERLKRAGHHVLAIVRDPARASLLAGAGFEPIAGSLTDHVALAGAVARADATINAADSDHQEGVAAILGALEGTGRTFIQVSGISVTADAGAGHASDRVLDEDSPFAPQPLRERRYAIDRAVEAASARGVRSMVVCCPLVYGAPRWPDRESVQLPFLVADARKRGAACHIGPGLNRWSHCHVDDVADLFALALTRGRPGALYYPENGEIAWGAIARMIGARLGLPVRSWSLEEAVAAWGPRTPVSYASNARTRGKRARAELGWTPRIDAIAADIDRLAAKTGSRTGA